MQTTAQSPGREAESARKPRTGRKKIRPNFGYHTSQIILGLKCFMKYSENDAGKPAELAAPPKAGSSETRTRTHLPM
jgi:hypothetical protein